MDICMVARFSDIRDEGERNVAYHLLEEVSSRHHVLALNLDEAGSPAFWKHAITGRCPDVIHYIGALTVRNVALLNALRTRWRFRPRTVFSVVFTPSSFDASVFPPRVRPDLVLCQSRRLSAELVAQGWTARALSNGVDLSRFSVPTAAEKRELRNQHGIGENDFIVLHVGHLKINRNLHLFVELPGRGMSGLVIASKALETDAKIAQELESAGCRVLIGFQPRVEEFYRLADCYLFPVQDGDSIATPLSVLEAMACGVPAVSRRFSGLEDLFEDGDGILFGENDDDLLDLVESVRNGRELAPRQHVERLSWAGVGGMLDEIYCEL
jgi:glycosyltransferase involved in cell wall biosynthesis